MTELHIKNTTTADKSNVFISISQSSVRDKLISRLHETVLDHENGMELSCKFVQAESALKSLPFDMIGLGAVSCVRRFETTPA